MTSKNDITGDKLISKTNTDEYRNGWDRLFSKKVQVIDDESFSYQTEAKVYIEKKEEQTEGPLDIILHVEDEKKEANE